jgi:hypothetical protein
MKFILNLIQKYILVLKCNYIIDYKIKEKVGQKELRLYKRLLKESILLREKVKLIKSIKVYFI